MAVPPCPTAGRALSSILFVLRTDMALGRASQGVGLRQRDDLLAAAFNVWQQGGVRAKVHEAHLARLNKADGSTDRAPW